jgi:hypothetical protein
LIHLAGRRFHKGFFDLIAPLAGESASQGGRIRRRDMTGQLTLGRSPAAHRLPKRT